MCFSAMKEGEKARKVGATNMNDKSSRSHTIFKIKIESTNRVDEEDLTVIGDEDEDGEYSSQLIHNYYYISNY